MLRAVSGAAAATPASIGAFATVKIQTFLATGTYTPSTGMLYCTIECLGSGGGGAGCAASATGVSGGGGGGSGGYSRKTATAAQVGASQAVTVGNGGGGGATGANNGSIGNDVSVGALCVAKGGSPGTQLGVNTLGQGGLGGVAGTGDLALQGNPGLCSNGASIATINGIGGKGGDSIFGGSPIQTVTGAGSAAGGSSATANTGAGGNGGSCCGSASTAGGGVGGSGIVIITEYCNQ